MTVASRIVRGWCSDATRTCPIWKFSGTISATTTRWRSIRSALLWQSDNDDDGNRATRINFVMEFGNYGYVDELTGQGWQVERANWEKEIPNRHWHLNDPGVVPTMLITGAGSPTGIMVYEGDLLAQEIPKRSDSLRRGPQCRTCLSYD
jgi:hypothetical protein